ncbi:MAG: class II aldolase, partial [Opitutae bacterium]|nr:class II aldolase [Opitutae bacterium]
CWLREAESRNIFVPVDYSEIVRNLEKGDDVCGNPKFFQLNEGTTLRPSIETSLHALMPQRYVIHVHSVNAISNAVLQNGEERVSQLLEGFDWSWVPYVRPGLPLTRAVQKIVRSNVDVLVLANHGLVLGAESKDEALELLNLVEVRLKRFRRDPDMSGTKNLLEVLKDTRYQPSKFSQIHSLAFDPVSLAIAAEEPLYPDHIVFLGDGPMSIMSEAQLGAYLKQDIRLQDHEVIIVRDMGVVKLDSLSESAEEMLHCLSSVLLRIQPGEKLRYLTRHEQAQILAWDAEKYRQANQS